MTTNERVYIHPHSFLFRLQPEYCVYREIIHTKKPYMKGLTAIKPEWLVRLGKKGENERTVKKKMK